MNRHRHPTEDSATYVSELDATLEAYAAPRAPGCEVAVCIDEAHPVLAGRVLCRFERQDGELEGWLPCLWHVKPRSGDRVLVMRAEGSPEAIVTGVIDGYRRRAEPDVRAAHVRALPTDESVRIESADGRGLVEVSASEEGGCTVRLLSDDAKLESSGKLAIEADEISIRARQGGVAVEAQDDVKLTGEQIHLN